MTFLPLEARSALERLKRLQEATWKHHLAAVKGWNSEAASDAFFRARRAVQDAEDELAKVIWRMGV